MNFSMGNIFDPAPIVVLQTFTRLGYSFE